MTNAISIDEKYSTTRLLTKEKPIIENRPEDKFETVLFLPEGENRKGEGGLRTKGYFKKSYKDKPLISIVTVVFNGEKYLEQTIKSVIDQSYDNVEYIIIDGGSTDGTLDIIKEYEEQIDYWVSEEDNGISDAFNKGIRGARGEFILMLNSGDSFVISSVIAKHISEFNDNDLVVFHAKVKGSDYLVGIDTFKNKSPAQKARLPHQGTFVQRRKYEQYGFYDTSYKIRMDYDFFLRIVGDSQTKFIHETLVRYDNTGISGQLKYRYQYEKEAILSEHKHLHRSSFYLLKCYYKPLLMTVASWGKNRLKPLLESH